MRVAVAGATGLLGRAVADALEAHGHAVLRAGRQVGDAIAFDAAEGSLDWRGAVGIDAFVHCAGVTDEDFRPGGSGAAKSGDAMEKLLQALRMAQVGRVAYVSSAHVYGPLEGAIDEARTPDPRSAYARAHLEAERRIAGTRDALLLRPCAVYGMPPSLAAFARWSLIPFDFPRQALRGEIVLQSAGAQSRNFVHAAAVAGCVAGWLERAAAGVEVRNVVGPETCSVYEFAALCARIAEEETARACVVRRGSGGAAAAPLHYRSRQGIARGGVSLEQHVRGLVRALRGRP